MDREGLATEIRELRARGLTPKAIAKKLGITRAEADAEIREIARAAANAEPALVGCWISSGWSQGLSWSGHGDWEDNHAGDDNGIPGLVTVLVVRDHRYEKLSACAYLVDAQCLGVKDVLGPRVFATTELNAFIERQFAAYARPPVRTSLELARELVFGAEAFARGLGFRPHRDFDACRDHLGTWNGPSPIVFGYRGNAVFMQGPSDDAMTVTEILEREVGVVTPPQRKVRRPVRMDEHLPVPLYSCDIPLMSVDDPAAPPPDDAPRGTPKGPISEALLRVMEPYIPWPPAVDELHELGEEVSFGATVWNATAQSTDPAKTAALLDAVVGMFSTGDPDAQLRLRAQVAEIAERKRRFCADDPRQIVRVDIVPNGRNVEVLALSAWYQPRESKP